MNMKKTYLYSIIGVFLLVVCTISLSYAAWQVNLKQESVNQVVFGCFRVSLQEEAPFSLAEAYPISDEEGNVLTPYTFTIQNQCESTASYQIQLEILNSSTLQNKDYIKVSLQELGMPVTTSLLKSHSSVATTLENATEAYQLETGVLEGHRSKTYHMRMWLSSDTPADQTIINKNLFSKIVITSALTDAPTQKKDLFEDYYQLASSKLETMTLDEKIGQLLLVTYTDASMLSVVKNYGFGGIIFFEKDFKGKTAEEVKKMTSDLQANSKIPLLMAVDEEGGKVNRISKNANLVAEPFSSSKVLYDLGGFDKIKEDTIEKSRILYDLGLNLNLAPVVDVSTNPTDYMYERSFGKSTALTNQYAKTVIQASKGTHVSYTLKHFPGYGNNVDTHLGQAIDDRTYEELVRNDLPPFIEGIASDAEAVLVSHNIVTSVDSENPASLSSEIHRLLRDTLHFTGIIITDGLDMGAMTSVSKKFVKSIQAGNDILIMSDYANAINEIKTALSNQEITEEMIHENARRILAWKYYKGMME